MTIVDLFQEWSAFREQLANPQLPEDKVDKLAGEAMQVVRSIIHTAAADLGEVLLKLEIFSREIEAGPCPECDALLTSVLQDRIAIMGPLGQMGMPATGPLPMERPIFDDDITIHPPRRGPHLGSPHP